MTSVHAAEPAAEPRNASVLVHNDRGEYLLHLRDRGPGIRNPGTWSLPGGGREPHDVSLEATARRELREEAGLDLPALRAFAVELVHDQEGSLLPVQVFTARWNGDPDALGLTGGVMLRWFRPEVMPRLRLGHSTLELVRRHAGPAAAPGAGAAAGGGSELHIVGAHLYLENPAGEVLLGLRHPDSAFAGGEWHFPAGHCERESAVACLVREADEEAGLRISPQDAEFAHAVHLLDAAGGRPRMQLVFRVRRWQGEPVVREPDKCLSWRWWHPDALPERLVPYTRAAIEGIRAGRAYTESGWA
ncbi:NUDIX domain-containing protein [Actinacidiphila glaucinigra]|uniref:NUDIX hydrolase n=1 Tax=Actinacidiphila glaucinigra TaxID=235986 RepID=UPI0036B823E8